MRSFLRTPMDASKITSRFGMREHPILGYSAMHAGVDFAAPSGTPILAAGAGKVTMAGYNGGYGLFVKLRAHAATSAPAYAHMSRLGPGIKPGVAVRQGQVIGFVGSTGMSTGPHLHYEFHRGGQAGQSAGAEVRHAAPRSAARTSRASRRWRGQYLAQLKNAPKVPVSKPEAKRDGSVTADCARRLNKKGPREAALSPCRL